MPTLLNMRVYMYTQYVVLDVILITGPRMEDSTALDLKSSISCVGNNCVPDLPIYHTTVLYCPLYAV